MFFIIVSCSQFTFMLLADDQSSMKVCLDAQYKLGYCELNYWLFIFISEIIADN